MEAPSVYIETTIVSYLAARLSRDLIVAGHQQITHDWWDRHRTRFRLTTSQFVLEEASAGDPDAASSRLELLRDIELLDLTQEAETLARELVNRAILPSKAATDAFHIAIAAAHGAAYLLTWNCKHIANAEIQPALTRLCLARGFKVPVLCTPEQLMGGANDE